jgi:hypothetical protein
MDVFSNLKSLTSIGQLYFLSAEATIRTAKTLKADNFIKN